MKVDGKKAAKFRGWNAKGIKRFNKQCEAIQVFRRTPVSIEFESILEEKYAELCGKNDKEDGMSGNENWNCGDRDDYSIDGYDGFSCDGVTTEATNIVGV